jgi:uncharacterized membrane protein YdjX (TVP38/TMEM64 family)
MTTGMPKLGRAPAAFALIAAGSLVGTVILWGLGGNRAVLDLLAAIAERRGLAITLFGLWALAANCLVLPAGSLSLIAGAMLLGTVLPAAIWYAAQLATAPLIHRSVDAGSSATTALVERYLGANAARLLGRAAQDGIWTTVVLRLTPVLPSAPAAMIAAWAGIDLRRFMLGSVLAGWVRPLYFASIGATIGNVARVGEAERAMTFGTLAPLLALAVCAAAMLAVRLVRARS